MAISGKFHAKKQYDQFFFPQKKKFRPTSENGRFRDFETEPETPFGNQQFLLFSKFNLLVQFFGEKFTGYYHDVRIITLLFRDHGQK